MGIGALPDDDMFKVDWQSGMYASDKSGEVFEVVVRNDNEVSFLSLKTRIFPHNLIVSHLKPLPFKNDDKIIYIGNNSIIYFIVGQIKYTNRGYVIFLFELDGDDNIIGNRYEYPLKDFKEYIFRNE